MNFQAKGININQIKGDNNIITTDPLLILINNSDSLHTLINKIENHKKNLRKEKLKIIDKIFLLSIPFLIFFILLIAAITGNHIKFTLIFMGLTFIPGILLANQFKKLEELAPKIKSTEELLIEIYKFVILNKIYEN